MSVEPIDEAIVAISDQGVLRVTINRPRKYNAFDRAALTLLADAVRDLPDDVGAVVLTGEGRAFAAGADITEYHESTPDQLRSFTDLANATCNVIRACPVPTIAAVNGLALGGGFEVAMSCDFVFASTAAQFGLPNSRWGSYQAGAARRRLPPVSAGPARSRRSSLDAGSLQRRRSHSASPTESLNQVTSSPRRLHSPRSWRYCRATLSRVPSWRSPRQRHTHPTRRRWSGRSCSRCSIRPMAGKVFARSWKSAPRFGTPSGHTRD